MSTIQTILLEYKDIFDDKPKSKEFYLKRIPREIRLVSALINYAIPNDRFNKSIKFLDSFAPELLPKIQAICVRYGIANSCILLFDIVSCLRIAELILQNKKAEETISNADYQINLIKLILVVNDEWQKEVKTAKKKIHDKPIPSLILSYFYRYDLEYFGYYQLGVAQILKSIEFFKYISKTEKFQQHLKLFLEEYDLDNWQEWILNLMYYASILISNDFKGKTFLEIEVENNKFYIKNCGFFNALSINEYLNGKFDKDFGTLRKYPVYKIEEGKYIIISSQFMIESIFDNAQSAFIKINDNIPNNKLKFKSISGQGFSEETLLYGIMKKSFPNEWIHVTGENFKVKNYEDSEPDYYLRFDNKVFLFECKDVASNGDIKQSFDYKSIKKELISRFYRKDKSNGNIEKKAILQLLGNIERINNNFFDRCDNEFDGKKVEIYPILITHNRQFDCVGINKLLSVWFNNELKINASKICNENVKPLTLINIEIFLLWHKEIKERSKFIFEELIDEFQNEVKKYFENFS